MNQIVEVEVSFRKFLDLEVDDFLNLHRYISCLLSFWGDESIEAGVIAYSQR